MNRSVALALSRWNNTDGIKAPQRHRVTGLDEWHFIPASAKANAWRVTFLNIYVRVPYRREFRSEREVDA
jgi:hypothetical protein